MKINAPLILYAYLSLTISLSCKTEVVATIEDEIPTGYRLLELSIPSGLYFQREPEEILNFTVDSIIQGLDIFTSNNDTSAVLKNKGQRTRFGNNKTAYLLGIPTMFNISSDDSVTHFEFGPSGADDNGAAAIVHVQYNKNINPTASQNIQHRKVGIFLKEDEILEYRFDDTNSITTPKKYLSIHASNNRRAKISIDTSAAKGRVLVCIIRKNPGQGQGHGHLLGILNPKNNNNKIPEFIVKVPVYIIPIIVPNISGNYGFPIDSIFFAVGDPKVNGSVTASEE